MKPELKKGETFYILVAVDGINFRHQCSHRSFKAAERQGRIFVSEPRGYRRKHHINHPNFDYKIMDINHNCIFQYSKR